MKWMHILFAVSAMLCTAGSNAETSTSSTVEKVVAVVTKAAKKVSLFKDKKTEGAQVVYFSELTLTVRFTLDKQGAVEKIAVVASTTADETVGQQFMMAITEAFKTERLEQVSGSYEIPVTFRSRGSPADYAPQM